MRPSFLVPAIVATTAGVGLDMIGNTLANAYPNTPHWTWVTLFWCSVVLFAGLPLWLGWWGLRSALHLAGLELQLPLRSIVVETSLSTPVEPSKAVSAEDASDFVPLNKAAEIVLKAIQGTAIAEALEDNERTPQKMLAMLSFQFLAKGIVWGEKWPSTERALITSGRSFYVLDDGVSLAYQSQQEAIIRNAVVKLADMDEYIRCAKSLNQRI